MLTEAVSKIHCQNQILEWDHLPARWQQGAIIGGNWTDGNSWHNNALQLPRPSSVVNWDGIWLEEQVLAYAISLEFK